MSDTKDILQQIKKSAQVTDYSDELKAELDNRYSEYINSGKLFSETEVYERINTLMNKNPK